MDLPIKRWKSRPEIPWRASYTIEIPRPHTHGQTSHEVTAVFEEKEPYMVLRQVIQWAENNHCPQDPEAVWKELVNQWRKEYILLDKSHLLLDDHPSS